MTRLQQKSPFRCMHKLKLRDWTCVSPNKDYD